MISGIRDILSLREGRLRAEREATDYFREKAGGDSADGWGLAETAVERRIDTYACGPKVRGGASVPFVATGAAYNGAEEFAAWHELPVEAVHAAVLVDAALRREYGPRAVLSEWRERLFG